jgi:hypothetical protein
VCARIGECAGTRQLIAFTLVLAHDVLQCDLKSLVIQMERSPGWMIPVKVIKRCFSRDAPWDSVAGIEVCMDVVSHARSGMVQNADATRLTALPASLRPIFLHLVT